MKIDRTKLDSGIFLLYDLLRVISVIILGNSNLMVFNVILILLLFFNKRIGLNIKNYGSDIFMYIKIVLPLLVSFVSVIAFDANIDLFILGMYLSIIPMIFGFLYSKKITLQYFAKIIFPVAIIDLILSILFYKELGLYRYLGSIGELLKSNLFLRMGINGSLRFGNFMLISFVLASYYNKNLILPFMLGVFFSLERSAWFGLIITVFLRSVISLRKMNHIKIMLVIFGIIICLLSLSYLITNYSDLFLVNRMVSMFSASSERMGQWINAFNIFVEQPIGKGIGQLGHTVRISNKLGNHLNIPIADGDYFRILAEEGIYGLLFFIMILFFCIKRANIYLFKNYDKDEIVVFNLIFVLMIQMIGSNITEFYFNNFLVWIIIGFFFKFCGPIIKKELRTHFIGKKSYIKI